MSINVFYRIIIFFAILFFLVLNALLLYANYNQTLIIQSERNRYASITTANEFLRNSEELTKMARLYTTTGQAKYKRYFEDILAIRNGKLPRPKNYSPYYWDYVLGHTQTHQANGDLISYTNRVKDLNFSDFELQMLKKSEQKANELASLEQKAFDLMQQPAPNDGSSAAYKKNKELASNLLHSEQYLQIKAKLLEPIEEFQLAVEARTEKIFMQQQLKQQYILYAFQAITFLALILCIIAYRYTDRQVVQPINALHHQAKKVAEGIYSSRNHIAVKNDLKTLGKTLNIMCAFIEKDNRERQRLLKLVQEGEERFRNAIEYAPIGMAIKSLDGKWVQTNISLRETLGYSAEEMQNLKPNDIIHPDDLAQETQLEQQLIKGDIKVYQRENRYIHKDGHIVWVLLSASLMSDNEGKPLNLIAQIHNIGPRKRREKEMKNLHEQMAETLVELQQRQHENVLLNKMNEMLHTCQNTTEAYAIILLTAKELFPILNGGLIIYDKTTQQMDTVGQWGEQQISLPSFVPNDCWALRNGNVYVVDDPAHAILCHHYLTPPTGGYINLPLIVRGETIGLLDINSSQGERIHEKIQQLSITFSESIKLALANINLREALRYQAIRDGLTGLFNRRYLDETLPRELEQMARSNQTLSLTMIDIDRFKRFNDEFGHDAGDEVLKLVGKILQQTIRLGDIACRYGGEEFVIILINASLEDARQRVNDICQNIKKTQLNFQGQNLPQMTVSAGIACAPLHGQQADILLGAADEALYAAKKAGSDRVIVYQADITAI